MTIEERIDRIERALLDFAMLFDSTTFTVGNSPVKWGEGTSIAELREEAERRQRNDADEASEPDVER